MGPYKQYVVYEKRRVCIQYVVFYKSNRPVPTLPPVPKSSKNSSTSRRRKFSPGRCTEQLPPSDDERLSVSDNDSDDDDDDGGGGGGGGGGADGGGDDNDHSPFRSQRESGQSLDPCLSPDTAWPEHRYVTNDYLSSTTGTCNDSVKRVAVTRRRTRELLQKRGQCLVCVYVDICSYSGLVNFFLFFFFLLNAILCGFQSL